MGRLTGPTGRLSSRLAEPRSAGAPVGTLLAGAAIVGALLLLFMLPSVAFAADATVDFARPTADSTFGKAVTFHQPATFDEAPERVEVLLSWPRALGPEVVEVDRPQTTGPAALEYTIEVAEDHIVPNTTIGARWRAVFADGQTTEGPPVSLTYRDDRFDWQEATGDLVRVHWYEGDADFGRRALKIGDDAVASTAALLGVSETEPIDFYIYADQSSFYDALGPATHENVGGQAHADIRTMFALVGPSEIDDPWVSTVVPHELVHLVFDTATFNPYHEPPHWLNEGLAVYLSEGYATGYRSQIEDVSRAGTVIPLDGLAGAFPSNPDRFVQGYAESVSAVDYLVRTFGREALVRLIRSYADGVSDDEAFHAALGTGLVGFEEGWLAANHAVPPPRHQTGPAPTGRLPAEWTTGGARNPAAPGAVGSGAAPTIRPGSPAGPSTGEDSRPVLAALVLGGVLLAAVGLIRARRVRASRRRRPGWSDGS
jgi:hypothetical protein